MIEQRIACGEIEQLAQELGATSAVAKAKFGATSRLAKRPDLTLADCRAFWDRCRTPQGKLGGWRHPEIDALGSGFCEVWHAGGPWGLAGRR